MVTDTERLTAIEARLVHIEEMVLRIHTTLDGAFAKFGSLTKSPMFAALLGGSKPKK